MLNFHVYMLRCSDGSYYVGHTEDLDLRLAQHERGEIPGYTSERRPVVLVWCGHFETRDDAFWFERKVKGWTRAKKEALIRGDFAAIGALAKGKHRHERVSEAKHLGTLSTRRPAP